MTEAKKPLIQSRDLVEGATTLVVALAWNEAAKKIIRNLYPINENNTYGEAKSTVLYALFVTILIIIIVFMYNKATITNKKIKDKAKKRQLRKHIVSQYEPNNSIYGPNNTPG